MNEMERAENGASLLALSIDVNENEQKSTSYSSFTVCKSGKPALLLNENKKPAFSEDTNSVLSGKGYVYIASERNVNDDKAALGDNTRLDCVSDSECLQLHNNPAKCICETAAVSDVQIKKLLEPALEDGFNKGFCPEDDDFGTTGVAPSETTVVSECCDPFPKITTTISGALDIENMGPKDETLVPNESNVKEDDVSEESNLSSLELRTNQNTRLSRSCEATPDSPGDSEVSFGTEAVLDTNDLRFMDVNLSSRNTFEVNRRQSAPDHLPDGLTLAADPSSHQTVNTVYVIVWSLFSRKMKDPKPPSQSAPGWKLFGKVPLRENPQKDSMTIQQEYEARTGKTVNLPPQSGRRKNLEFEPLSTTALILEDRPANLPAKSAEEALRHRHEYDLMVAEAKKREMKDAHKKKKIMKERYKQEEVIANAMVIWNSEILPNWEAMRNMRKVRELWWQGLPPSVRGKVWSLAVGNELNITHELYEIFLSRAKEKWKSFSETGSEYEAEDSGTSGADRESSLDLIKLDISRTFPSLFIFQKGGPYHDLLHSVLGAYTCYRPDVGYVQGMSFIAAVLILNLEEADAFILFANLLNKPCQMAFFRVDHDLMLKYFAAFEVFFEENLPRLFVHFKTYNLTPDIYLIDWIFTLYSKSLPLDLACRVWDVFCRDGEEFLFRTGLGILKLYEDILLQMDFIHIAQFLTKLPEDITSEKLFNCIAAVQMLSSNKKWTQMDFIHIAQFLTKLPEDITSEKLFNCIAAVQMLSSNKKWTQRKSKKKAPSFRKLLKTSNIKIENKLKNRQFKQQSIAKKHRKEQKKLKQALSNAATRTPLPLERYKKRPEDEEDEEEFEETLPVDMMEEDDLEQMKAMAQKASFLTRDLSSSEPVHARKRKQENVMDKYEKVPRLMQKEQEKELIHLLPIKDKTGIIPQTMEKPVVKKAEKENEDEGDGGDGAEEGKTKLEGLSPKSKKKAPSFRKLLKTSNIKIENKLKNRQFKQQSIAKKHRKEQKKLKQALSNAATRTPLPLERYKKRPEDEEDEEEFEETLPVDMMEEDDLEQMKAMAQKASFLTRDLSSSEPVHARKRKQENVMDKYEKVPRLMQKEQEKELIHLLPIKDKTGIIPQTMEKPVVKKAEKENEDEGDGDGAEEEWLRNVKMPEHTKTPEEYARDHKDFIVEDNKGNKVQLKKFAINAPKPLPLLTTQELVVLRRKRLEERKVCIAALGSSILSDPSANIKKLKELRSMLVELDPYVAVTVRKLVMVSLMEIFKDIVPSYRIRPLTEAEKSTKVKKETQQLREFEEGLVSQYKFYLENLEQTVKDWKQMKKKKSDVVSLTSYKGLAEVAVKCLCELLVALPHFNFHNNIIVMIVPLMNHDCKKVLKALLCLRVKEVEVKKDADDIAPKKRFMNFKEKRKHLSRMQRKWKKAEEKLEKELLEAEATECKEKKLKLHTETLNIVFLTYFRILKKAQKSILLPCVLEGLAKFAHLINVEFFDDLLIVLHKLVESGDLSYRESLHCIQTAFHVLSGQGDVLNIDPLKFYTHLYKTLLRLHAGTANDDMIIVLQCLDVMLTKRRKQVSVQRALAFIKRLTTLSLQVLPNSTIGILATNRVLMHTFPKSDILLDNESQGSGIYLPELDEPEYCNPQNTSLWELHTLQRHYHPIVRKFAAHLIVGAPSEGSGALNVDLSRKSATDLFEDYSIKGMTFNPPVATPSSKKKEEEEDGDDEVG
ncbi:UNVERIFIED_CONTAM: hypothetical protein FKN15_008498 [Acipenser sinensis]